mmetsp:Transcript_14193/g.57757  ORF Transcript_14193/g.57757 Transcript_14193/m.57757 type:complete len:356 (+) Transcript_14193:356-1423(+)
MRDHLREEHGDRLGAERPERAAREPRRVLRPAERVRLLQGRLPRSLRRPRTGRSPRVAVLQGADSGEAHRRRALSRDAHGEPQEGSRGDVSRRQRGTEQHRRLGRGVQRHHGRGSAHLRQAHHMRLGGRLEGGARPREPGDGTDRGARAHERSQAGPARGEAEDRGHGRPGRSADASARRGGIVSRRAKLSRRRGARRGSVPGVDEESVGAGAVDVEVVGGLHRAQGRGHPGAGDSDARGGGERPFHRRRHRRHLGVCVQRGGGGHRRGVRRPRGGGDHAGEGSVQAMEAEERRGDHRRHHRPGGNVEEHREQGGQQQEVEHGPRQQEVEHGAAEPGKRLVARLAAIVKTGIVFV